MNVVEILTQAKELVANHYTRGYMARTNEGGRVYPTHPKACSWCSAGSLFKVANASIFDGSEENCLCIAAWNTLDDAAKTLINSSAAWLNDNEPKRIPEMFDLAIKLAKEQQ